MSAILSADDLNDFISPGVACIKPVETLPKQQPEDTSNPYEVKREDQIPASAADAPPAQISLTDCLACSGCVTSAEAVLVSLQSHQEVVNTLDQYESFGLEGLGQDEGVDVAAEADGSSKLFVASVSPQTRASLAALYGVTEREAGNMISHLLAGPQGLQSGGAKRSGFTWVIDTNTVREICRAGIVEECVNPSNTQDAPRRPILASACPGWICYAEKTHPHVLPHLSRLKSPQAMSGTLLKSILSRKHGISPDRVWHLAVMPCFDKKLEASREELTDVYWKPDAAEKRGVRDVDCVITARELVMLADMRGISLPGLPRTRLQQPAFPDKTIDRFLFHRGMRRDVAQIATAGSSGGYAYQILRAQQRRMPGSEINVERGRNADVIEYMLQHNGTTVAKTARYYGFQNIQNLVRKLKPAKQSRMPGVASARKGAASASSAGARQMAEYAYVEVMACPGGCTNGGGQIKASDVAELTGVDGGEKQVKKTGPAEQKEWLRRVDEAYYSDDESEADESTANGGDDAMDVDDQEVPRVDGQVSDDEADEEARVQDLLKHWTASTGVPLDKLLFTAYRQVESDVGKAQGQSDTDRVAGLAHSIGGGW